jgi:ABC transporter with metal-binding/Fe-S-binding domain ATP-binding protein
MRLASLLSGGKDSIYSIQLAREMGHDVTHAVTIFPERDDSYMFHVPNLWLTELQARTMGIKHVRRSSSGKKEEELADLREALSGLEVDGVVAGAISSSYQYSRVSNICEELSLKVITPLWGHDPESILDEVLAAGYRVMIVGVYADGLDEDWLGRVIDGGIIAELRKLGEKRGIAMSFEGGEAETLVLDCPIFGQQISVQSARRNWQVCRGEYEILEASLVAKTL